MMCTAAAPRGLTARITWGYEVSIHNQMSERPRGWKGWGVGGGGGSPGGFLYNTPKDACKVSNN